MHAYQDPVPSVPPRWDGEVTVEEKEEEDEGRGTQTGIQFVIRHFFRAMSLVLTEVEACYRCFFNFLTRDNERKIKESNKDFFFQS